MSCRTKLDSEKTRKIATVFGSVLGGIGAFAVKQWPDYAFQLQIALYTLMVLGILSIGFWSHRNKENFWKAYLCVTFIHVAFLIAGRSLFPFKTILAVVPIAILEATIAAVIFLKVLGYQ